MVIVFSFEYFHGYFHIFYVSDSSVFRFGLPPGFCVFPKGSTAYLCPSAQIQSSPSFKRIRTSSNPAFSSSSRNSSGVGLNRWNL